MADKKRRRHIFVAEHEHELPYSKGLTASSLMITGLGPARSYGVANKVEEALRALERDSVTEDELQDLTLEILRREAGDEFADKFTKWQTVATLDMPLIILIGGATGVGKSTIATQLASRLGITRAISTDAVREVLRSAFTRDMFPTLYESSFESDKAVRQPIPHSGDRLIIGFREQAAAVAVGAQSLIDRAVAEGTDLIVEGAHLVPGFLEKLKYDRAVVVPLLISIEDEELHKSHFYFRTRDSRNRPADRYLANFKKIRRLQKYMTSSALMRGVPVIQHEHLDTTMSEIIDHVITKLNEAIASGVDVSEKDQQRLERAIDVGEKADEGSITRETVS